MLRFLQFLILAAGLAGVCGVRPAAANPYIWVDVQAIVVYGHDGAPVAIRQTWRFDEHFSAFAVKGVDRNGDGTYEPEELASAAALNVQALRDFGYFTNVSAGGRTVAVGAPTAKTLSYEDGHLVLRFALPLLHAPATEAEGLTVKVYDPAYFIAFALAPGTAVSLDGAPLDCRVALDRPKQPRRPADPKSAGLLSRRVDIKSTEGVRYANTATVECGGGALAFAPPAATPTPFPPAAAAAPGADVAVTADGGEALRIDHAIRLTQAAPAVIELPRPAGQAEAPPAAAPMVAAAEPTLPRSGRAAATAAGVDAPPTIGFGGRELMVGVLVLGLGTLLLGGFLVRGSLMR